MAIRCSSVPQGPVCRDAAGNHQGGQLRERRPCDFDRLRHSVTERVDDRQLKPGGEIGGGFGVNPGRLHLVNPLAARPSSSPLKRNCSQGGAARPRQIRTGASARLAWPTSIAGPPESQASSFAALSKASWRHQS